MKFIKNLARPLLLDFAGALKKKTFMQAKKKRRLHAVPNCGSDRLKRQIREGSVDGPFVKGPAGSFCFNPSGQIE